MKKILIPFDFSEAAMHALKFCSEIAEESGSDITLMNVIEHPTPTSFKTMGVEDYDPMENIYIAELIKKVKSRMEEIMEDNAYGNIDLNYKIVVGNVFMEVKEEIEDSDTDLVVMGTTGASGLEEFFVGSNAEKIVRHAKCPVITLREEITVDDIEDIVFATNLEKTTDNFINALKAVQEFFDAQLRLVKINTPSDFRNSRDDLARMNSFINSHKLHNCTTEIYNFESEEGGILAYAEDIDANMIAMGTHQRTGFSHFFTDSLAEGIVNHAKRPVWTYNLEA